MLSAGYARAIDDDRLEDWPEFILDPCVYKIASADDYRRVLEAGLVYADSKACFKIASRHSGRRTSTQPSPLSGSSRTAGLSPSGGEGTETPPLTPAQTPR